MADINYAPIGMCIYCRAKSNQEGYPKFGDEHIIPLGLGGNLVLQQASCRRCEKVINQQIENPIQRGEWGALRERRKFPSRNKSKRRQNIPVVDKHGGTFQMPLADYPSPVPLYRFKPASILSGKAAINDTHWTMSVLTDTESESSARVKHPEWSGCYRLTPQPYRFARFLAKIGHARAVAEYGLENFYPTCIDIILGKSSNYFSVVGGQLDILPAITNGDHILELSLIFRSPTLAYLVVDIRLFSKAPTPSYHVVAGIIDLHNPTHSRALSAHKSNGKLQF